MSSPTKPNDPDKIPVVEIVLRPVNQGWSMGEDWHVLRPLTSTMYDLRVFLEEEKGINRNRIMLRVKGKLFAASKEKWTFRRLGLYDGYVIDIEPTMSGSWWWHPIEHYAEIFIQRIESLLERAPGGGLFLHDLEPVVEMPPPIKKSLKVFLRIYPERFFLYSDTKKNTTWVRRTTNLIEIPAFETVPHILGQFAMYKDENFDWDSYADIDDKYKVETYVTAEEEEEARRKEKEDAELAIEAELLANGAVVDEVDAESSNENKAGDQRETLPSDPRSTAADIESVSHGDGPPLEVNTTSPIASKLVSPSASSKGTSVRSRPGSAQRSVKLDVPPDK